MNLRPFKPWRYAGGLAVTLAVAAISLYPVYYLLQAAFDVGDPDTRPPTAYGLNNFIAIGSYVGILGNTLMVAFAATLMALAILEHWFLVLPIPAETLWAWSLHRGKEAAKPGMTQSGSGPLTPVRMGDPLDAGSFSTIRHTLLGRHRGVRIVFARQGTPARWADNGGVPLPGGAAAELSAVMAIGRDGDGPGLLRAFAECAVPGALQHG